MYRIVFTTDTMVGVQYRTPPVGCGDGWFSESRVREELEQLQAQTAEHLMFWRIEQLNAEGTLWTAVQQWHRHVDEALADATAPTPPAVTAPARGSAMTRFLELGQ